MALAIGWVVGAVAAVWFVVWFGALALYVDDFSIETVPAIAYTPHWVFAMALLLLLGKTKEMQAMKAQILSGRRKPSGDSVASADLCALGDLIVRYLDPTSSAEDEDDEEYPATRNWKP